MGRADIEEASRGVDVDSCPRRLCYPWGNFSVTPGPQREGHEGSLGPAFTSGPLIVKGPVRPAFGLALYGGVLSRLSWPLGTLDIFSRVCRPSQTAHLPLSRVSPVREPATEGWCFIGASTTPGRVASTAPTYATHPWPVPSSRLQLSSTGSSLPAGGSWTVRQVMWVHRAPAGDSGDLVGPFMHAGIFGGRLPREILVIYARDPPYPARHLATFLPGGPAALSSNHLLEIFLEVSFLYRL